jgi:hypothetical protein
MAKDKNQDIDRVKGKALSEISKKLNILISLSIRHLMDDKEFTRKRKRKQGVGDLARYLYDMRLDATDIAEILSAPLSSVRTLLTPKRRK